MTSTLAYSTKPARVKPLRPANQQALEITGREYLSFSQVNTMRSCPKKFDLHYIQQAKPDFIPASLAFGSAIHAAIETHYRGLLAGVILSASELQQAYHLTWQEQTTEAGKEGKDVPVKYAKDQNEQILDELAKRMIASFLVSPLATPDGTLLGIEEQFTTCIDRELPDVLARVDMLYEAAEAIVVRDLKTSRSRWNEAKVNEQADQLVLYAHLLTQLAEGFNKPVQAEFAVITKAKTPVVQLLPVQVNLDRIDQFRQIISSVWAAICSGNFYPNPSPMSCTTCPYKSRCPAFNGG